jgi:hypothetical protein
MTPEAQVEAALKLLEPSFEKKAFCEGWITTALAAVDADKQQTRHEKDVASKIARLDLKTYRAAIKRAQRAFWSLPEGMRKKLGLLAALEQTALPDFAALIAVCDRALPSQLALRAEFDRYSSATWAWNVLVAMGEQPTATRGGKWAKLAAILYGSKDDDFFHYCRMVINGTPLDQTLE